MPRSIASISKRISEAFEARSRALARGSLFVKLVLVIIGSGAVSALQFAQIPEGQDWTNIQAVGVVLSAVVCLGAIYLALTEIDSSKELALARTTLEELRDESETADLIVAYEDLIGRQIALYQSFNAMRSCLESVAILSQLPTDFSQKLLDFAGYMLPVAMGFEQEDRWTICIFRAEPGSDGLDVLRCVAHRRRIECDINDARTWREGVGVAGISYANRQEVIVPDMQAAGLGTIFNLASDTRDYDGDRYRSIAAVPIKVEGSTKPWGVVVATNDRIDHFDHLDMSGLQTAEGVRLIAGMVAIGVSAPTSQGSQTGTTDSNSPQGGGD